jgi:hypothetical protein
MMQIQTRRAASTSMDPRTAAREMFDALHAPDMALAIFYCSPSYDLTALGAALAEQFGPDAPLIGCTTAVEVTPVGYLEGAITGVSLAGRGVLAHTERIERLRALEPGRGELAAQAALRAMQGRGVTPTGASCFGFVLCDGMAVREDALVSALYASLPGIPLIGGSTGDGIQPGPTHLYHRGRFLTDCALFTLMSTPTAFKVFRTEHPVPVGRKLVVTGADPARRAVTEINGHPAAREYARRVGIAADQVGPAVFAAHPLVVSVAGNGYVRSIRGVNDDGSLALDGAIDEGTVFTIAEGLDIVRDLEEAFAGVVRELGPPALVLGCDCVLRYLEIAHRGCRDDIDRIFTDHHVVGFATYCERLSAIHANQTFTGVAISAR